MPQINEEKTGRFSVRIAASVHKALSVLAGEEGISLNALVSYVLAHRVGMEDVAPLRMQIAPTTIVAMEKGKAVLVNKECKKLFAQLQGASLEELQVIQERLAVLHRIENCACLRDLEKTS